MKFTCLSGSGGFHFPPCHILNVCGFRILIDCSVDLSALTVFSPVPTEFNALIDEETSCCLGQKDEKPLDASTLIFAEPWYKTVKNLQLWNLSSIDIVLISSPMGMLGLPFLTRAKGFSAKIYATEATMRLGQIVMEELVSMHMEFRQFYGSEDGDFPLWMLQGELEQLPSMLREVALGKDGAELGDWLPLYSAVDVKDCLKKVQALRYAEEACYNGTLIIKPFSSGLEIGACNWTINGPKRNIAIISSSIFVSSHAMNFDYRALQGNEIIIYSDFSLLDFTEDVENNRNNCILASDNPLSTSNPDIDLEALGKSLCEADEGTEEQEKVAFVCSCAIDTVNAGGSVLIPVNRLGITLQLLEQISALLESSTLKVPIYMISSVAKELLAFTSVIPEWLCEERQAKLFAGESIFAHVELLKENKLQVFPEIYSSKLLTNWQEPCIVFCPHWSLRLGPVVHLLRRWSGDPNSLLVLEKGLDAELALLPFRPIAMKVLQCSFLSGIKLKKIEPLLNVLQPKVLLLPEDLSCHISSPSNSFSVFPYSENKTLRIPNMNNPELEIATDLATNFHWEKVEGNMNITRLSGTLLLEHGKHRLLSENNVTAMNRKPLIHWGSPDSERLLSVLSEKGISGSIEQRTDDAAESEKTCIIHLDGPNKAMIEIRETMTVIIASNEDLSTVIFNALDSVLNGV